ncbi:MAG: RES family NAD+ phosphorylase [Burkholderiaceae bacterium]
MTPPTTSLQQPATVRLVPTAYYKPPVLRALADDDEEFALLAALEGLTSHRVKAQLNGMAGLDSRELAFNVWGQSSINAAFTYTRPEGNRFNDSQRGAWYAAFDDLTAIAEVAFHRTRELDRANHWEDEVVYQVLLADFIGRFHDLREAPPDTRCLNPDPLLGYPAGQELAIQIREQNGLGVVYPSVRRAGGVCLAAFRPHVVQNVRPGARWRLIWKGSAHYTIAAD